MLNNNYLCALDISSSKIAAVAVELKNKKVSEIFFEIAPSRGIRKGTVVDPIELVNSIGGVLKKLKQTSGLKIKCLSANISGQDISTTHSHAIIPLAERGNKVITSSDVYKVNEQARILGSSLEEEIIHSVPYGYTIDSKSGILNPVGLYSHRLEVDLYLIFARLSGAQSLARAINQSGYEIRDLFFSGLATSAALLNQQESDGVEVICDIGSDITELLIFRNARLSDIAILENGGDDITRRISDELKIPFELAEEVKRSHALVGDHSRLTEDKEILVRKNDLYRPIKERVVVELATLEAKNLCQVIKEKLDKVIPAQRVSGFTCCGRTVMLDGLLEALENTLGISVKLARLANPEIVSLANRYDALSGQRYLTYLTALGLIALSLHPEQSHALYAPETPRNALINVASRVREIYQEYF